ncbi:conserved hypothetical protein [Solidesulfovibrio fructosivorans JJ]]|uniref:Outer-membrane lipoprotein LolB n=1 Tax=Solidesulfovibrio fructosivorans JJ] TaxID=596151 RepID=E1K0Y0_SOLFR|nr:hypothetical protein [Solidesulfovibrio fructosivorans]EFL49745.1 conserved hypothetical protein [Solidesulfovibrio fructosivorans JJ]]
MRRFPLPPRLLVWIFLALLATGCAAPRPGRMGSGEAKAVYASFVAGQAKNTPAPAFSLAGSMSFSRGSRSGRLNFRFYGNYVDPVRLDLSTPIGGAYAHLREDGAEFSAFVPGRDTLYRHEGTREGAARLGMPLPFTLREMAALVSGRFGELVPARYASAQNTADGYEYHFTGDPRLSALTLDFAGNPRHLTGVGVEPWRVTFDNDEAAPGMAVPVARKLVLTTPGGTSLIIRVKSLQARQSPYPAADLELPVPPNATVRGLDAAPGDSPLPEL